MDEKDLEQKNNELEVSENKSEQINKNLEEVITSEEPIQEAKEPDTVESIKDAESEPVESEDKAEHDNNINDNKEPLEDAVITTKTPDEVYKIAPDSYNTTDVDSAKLKKSKRLKYLSIGGVGFLLGAIMFSPSSENAKKIEVYDSTVKQSNELTKTNESLKKENKELKEKVEEAAPWFRLSEEEKNEQLLSQAKKENAKYLNLVDSDKSYYDMTEEEREIMDEWIDTEYDKSITQFQDAYKDKYDKALADRESSLEKIEAEKKAAEEKKKKEEEEARKKAEAEKYNTGLTWEKIAREGMIGTLCQFKGKVLQVMKGDGYVQCRVATKGNYDDVMLIEVHDIDKTILEGDSITFKGMSMGTIEYTTVLGAELSVPAVLVAEYTLK